ncbi:hypothetical protein [Desertivirga arenae]|uniref:hypothetical protein n=1 Tax=Desertivirga arenae TaxID=2810309 RepID=UPI001A95D936|nr:hypothetical protein [Pedobacter sp. SYSU D00823]
MKSQLLVLTALLFIIASCQNEHKITAGGSQSFKEIKRVVSPDKKVEAVVAETNRGATVATGNLVFIVLPGRSISDEDRKFAMFNADYCSGLNIRWKQDRVLSIEYEKARIFNFTNFWQSDSLENWNYVVEIGLNCTSQTGQLNSTTRTPMSN